VPFGFTPVAVCNRLGAKAEVKQESKAKGIIQWKIQEETYYNDFHK
jgi:hypothetical protein